MYQSVSINGPIGLLEGEISIALESSKAIIAIVCHPNPTQGGTMKNKVVTTISRTFEQLGITCLRFNFRGVGKSEGSYGQIDGEIADLEAVLEWVKSHYTDHAIYLAGFSFGSFIAAKVANQRRDITQLVSVAPPVTVADFESLNEMHCNWLVVASDADEVISFEAVLNWISHPPSCIEVWIVQGASHFFHGRLVELENGLLNRLKNHDRLIKT